MNNKQLITINQNSKLALIKSRNLLDITKKILDKKELIKSFEFKPFLMEKGHSDYVRSVVISPDGKYIVSGSDDNTIKILDFKTAECLKTIKAFYDGFTLNSGIKSSLIFNEEKIIFLSKGYFGCRSGEIGTIRILDIKTDECLKDLDLFNVSNLKVDTVDSFQGEESDIIIYSTVKTNGNISFLIDKKRLNVAISRTKENLFFIGKKDFFYNARMKKDEVNLFEKIINFCNNLE